MAEASNRTNERGEVNVSRGRGEDEDFPIFDLSLNLPPGLVYFMSLVRDFITFFIRGGLSTLMFCMDFLLGFFIFLFDTYMQLPGANIVGLLARLILWLYQICMWIVYTMLELLVYLPTPLLILYLILLTVLYAMMPAYVEDLLYTMFWLAEKFLHLVKYVTFQLASDKNDGKSKN